MKGGEKGDAEAETNAEEGEEMGSFGDGVRDEGPDERCGGEEECEEKAGAVSEVVEETGADEVPEA